MYDTPVYIHGQRVQEEPIKSDDPLISIVGIGGVTRSGRIFAPTPPPIENGGPSAHDKETHRDALVKFLKAAHVPQEISVCQFEGIVNNIATSLSLGFNDMELPTEGRNHNKSFHISIECVDTILSRVLVDTSSSLNVMPKSSLAKLTIEGLVMKPSELVVRAFRGSRRIVIGEVLQLSTWEVVDSFIWCCYLDTPPTENIYSEQQAGGCRRGRIFFGFIVTHRGIEVDPDKVKAIQVMPPPKTEKEVRGFLSRLNYFARFISHLTAICEPIFKLLRKDKVVIWNDDGQRAFGKIKEYLQEPPFLMPPVPGKPFIMYLTVLEGSMGCVLGQHDETGRKEHVIYYLGKKFTDYENRYSMLEKKCCTLAWTAKFLR
ncbi:uncharacterized protein LOC127094739 [Lathyrus oleraceus]|uniref:uncharacterized protein LOC127094739 n=1 Tax=Pisum sativum TaxID=3888 RepID=UPI0021D21FAE|nr:uncharacterized protein LOC127094739 [Pisum sativum]